MKLLLSSIFFFIVTISYSQNLIFDDYSIYNLGKIDGQNGYSTATPSTGNGTGSCVGVSCIYSKIIDMAMGYPILGNPTRALLCSDTTNLQTADGPGKSLGVTINSGAVYVAVLVNCYQQNGTGTSKQIVRLMDNGFNVPCRIYVKNASGGSVQFGVSKSSGGTTWGTNTYGTNQDHLIVMKYEFKTGSTSNDVVSVFVDPDVSLPEPASPTFSITGNSDATSITRVVFPWNATSTVFNGYIGITSVAQSWATIIPQANPTYAISGRVVTPVKKLVPNSNIKYKNGQSKDSITTSATGTYSFNNLNTANYVLKANRINEVSKSNGVTSVDVLLVQRHILGTTILNSPYKIIAADVDGNKLINAVDVLRIKRLILGTDTTFKNSVTNENRTWAFVDSSYVFPDTTNPFPFRDSIVINNLNSNQNNVSFIGIKLGDVNFDWNPAVAKGISSSRRLNLKSIVRSVDKNVYTLNIDASAFKNLAALQFMLHFDHTEFELIDIQNENLNFDFNKNKAGVSGDISCLWINNLAKHKSLKNNTTLFTIKLKARKSSTGIPSLTIKKDLINAEAVNESLEKFEVSF